MQRAIAKAVRAVVKLDLRGAALRIRGTSNIRFREDSVEKV
jgi:hypothetical protein